MTNEKNILLKYPYAQLLLLIVIFLMYLPNLFLPYIQDDCCWIYQFTTLSVPDNIDSILGIENKLFFRPLGQLYLYGMYLAFGDNPLITHLAALLIHFFNTLLIIRILEILIKDNFKAWLAGFLYAGAASLHLDTLSWMVGIYELGAMFFSMLTVLLFLKNKKYWYPITFLLAISFKESVVILPFILIAVDIYRGVGDKASGRLKSILKNIAPVIPIVLLYVLYKSFGRQIHDLPAGSPYEIQLFGLHIVKNAYLYLLWGVQAILPFSLPFSEKANAVIFAMILAIIGIFTIWLIRGEYRRYRFSVRLKQLLMFSAWVVIGLGPVFFLVRHSYRYYFSLSLPAFIAIVLILLGLLFEKLSRNQQTHRKLFIILTVFCLCLSTYHIYWVHHEGLGQSRLVKGTNYLIQRADLVELVKKKLQTDKPIIKEHSYLVFDNIDPAAFGYNCGPRVWLKDTTIQVLSVTNDPKEIQKLLNIPADSSKAVFYSLVDDRVKRISTNEINTK